MPAAYQDENGKWFKQCSKTGQLFGPVDNLEDLSEWFNRNCKTSDLLRNENKEYQKERGKQYRENNADKIKERDKQYRENNQDRIRQYRENNQDRIKQYRENNKDKMKEKDKQYRKTPAGLLAHYKNKAKERGINFTLTIEWFKEQTNLPQFEYCAISGIKFINEPNHPFSRSLDRISSTKGYTPDNVRWVCFKYNSWKSDLTLNDVSLIFKYMSKSAGYDPIEYMREVEKGNPNPHLVLENNP
jgi:hypothetical protein